MSVGTCFRCIEVNYRPEIYDYLKKSYPNANVVFASTAGEIMGSDVYDDSIVVTAVELEKSL
ncbi:FIST N-terminal domain-containing protein [Mucilaginibacter gossypii]|uniref:FIST N-terminal domain-containing protein n=1 Tax=Mucilaginibacter gossypii TaxID=551996 RepID=UPI000DCBDE85|nr:MULTISPECIES: FIST N-terminal domain-containing protein [Mucilaginibacter]QTE37827.1 FIST N-terminal domain-containing protein [Mucilaginibacter gossypii]RAV60528.1 hypothetical protein DIU36_00240 [Mucilaginibacter rubeus]